MLQGLEGDSLYIIDAGQVKVVDDINHHQITNLGPDDVVGEISLLTGNFPYGNCNAPLEKYQPGY